MNEEMLEKISSNLNKGLSISLVFGNPIETQGKTIIPVSKVAGGFGGGEGTTPEFQIDQEGDSEKPKSKSKAGHGIGGGGGLHNEPVGVFEIGQNYTRFIPAVQFKHVICLIGMFLVFFWRISRKKKN